MRREAENRSSKSETLEGQHINAPEASLWAMLGET
jgi:hypothetical protein